MQSYWIYQRRDNMQWEGMIEEQRCEVEDIDYELSNESWAWVAGSLHIVEAESLAEALVTVMPVGEVIRRMFDDILEFGNEFAYHKWFGEGGTAPFWCERFDENGGMNKEAAESLKLANRFLPKS